MPACSPILIPTSSSAPRAAGAAWLSDNQLLADTDRLADIPGVLIHGQLDIGAPLRTAWQLAQAWPDSRLVILPAAGHTSASLGHQVVAATDAFAAR